MTDYNERTSVDAYVRGILREVQGESEFAARVGKIDVEQPRYVDRLLAAVYLWGNHLRVGKAIEVMAGRRIAEETLYDSKAINDAVVRAWEKPESLTAILESFYNWKEE